MRYWIVLLVVLVGGARADSGPNIVFILADDLGIGDVNCYGGDRCLIETPHIDALSREGLRFTDAYVNASVCIPTRRALMTGRFDWRFAPPVQSGPWGFIGPKPGTEKFTLGKLLTNAGYQTGYVGKWHLGTIMETKDGAVQGPDNVDYTQPIKYGPRQFGFKESFILPGSLDMFPYAYVRNHQWQGTVTAQKGWSAFNRVGPAAEDFEDHEVLETFYREAERFIDSTREGSPFFLFLALTAPHTPISPGIRWQGKSEIGIYGDFVMEVDHGVERMVEALRAKGVEEDTLVLFSSDHGPAAYAGTVARATPDQVQGLEDMGHYPSGPHRGYKFSVYEGGLRVPLIAKWPGVIPDGSTCRELVGLCDLMATFADLTGQPLEADQGPDSISFAPLLRSPEASGERTDLVMRSVVSFVIRDGPWKLCLSPGSGVSAGSEHAAGNDPMPEAAWRMALEQFGGTPTEDDLLNPPFVQLFNLANDPHEDRNLASDNRQQVREMVALLKEHINRGRSTPGPALRNDKPVRLVNLKDRRLPGLVR